MGKLKYFYYGLGIFLVGLVVWIGFIWPWMDTRTLHNSLIASPWSFEAEPSWNELVTNIEREIGGMIEFHENNRVMLIEDDGTMREGIFHISIVRNLFVGINMIELELIFDDGVIYELSIESRKIALDELEFWASIFESYSIFEGHADVRLSRNN